jgi:hypothetical protein
MSPSYYDVAQACLNGHVVTEMAQTHPDGRRKFCKKCGESTITACTECDSPIPGWYHVEGIIDLVSQYELPSYCHNCGKPYPWSTRKLDAAVKLASEDGHLTVDEVETFKQSIQDVTRETADTPLAINRLKVLLPKLGQVAAQTIRDILVDIVSEGIKKAIYS